MKTTNINEHQYYLEDFEEFKMICDYQHKNVSDVLSNFIKKYNEKYADDYQKALDSFWNTL